MRKKNMRKSGERDNEENEENSQNMSDNGSEHKD